MKCFFKDSFVLEIGIVCVFMNRIGKSNVKKGFDKDYNVFKDFMDREIEVYIFIGWMKFVGMNDMKGIK